MIAISNPVSPLNMALPSIILTVAHIGYCGSLPRYLDSKQSLSPSAKHRGPVSTKHEDGPSLSETRTSKIAGQQKKT